MSKTCAAGLSPPLSSASGVINATWLQAAQSTLTKSPSPRSSAPYQRNRPQKDAWLTPAELSC
jgi:hypothetical protein